MAEIKLLESIGSWEPGRRGVYMQDLYDQTFKGSLGPIPVDITSFKSARSPLFDMFYRKAITGGNRFMLEKQPGINFYWDERYDPNLIDAWIQTKTSAISCSSSSLGTEFTVPVVNNGKVKVNDVIRYQKKDGTGLYAAFLVTEAKTSDQSGSDPDQIKVKLINGSPGTDVPSGAKLSIVGSAYGEFSDVSKPQYEKTRRKFGSCQILKNSIKVSRRLMDMSPAEYYYQLETLAYRHKASVEKTLLFGVRPEGYDMTSKVPDNNYDGITFTMGLNQAIGFAKTSPEGSVDSRKLVLSKSSATVGDIIDSLERYFEYSSDSSEQNRLFFGGNGILSLLRKVARASSQIQINNDNRKSKLGINVQQIVVGSHTLDFISHPLLTNEWQNAFYVVDPGNIELKVEKQTSLEEQEKGVNSESKTQEYITDVGLAVKCPNLHMSGYVVD